MQQQVELAKTVAELNEQEVGDYLERMKHQVLFEAWIDKTNPIRVLQDAIMKIIKNIEALMIQSWLILDGIIFKISVMI